jgi:hypothetical protein
MVAQFEVGATKTASRNLTPCVLIFPSLLAFHTLWYEY